MLPYHFCCFFFLDLRAISKYKSPGAYIRRGDLTKAFFALRIRGGGGLIFGEAYTWRGFFSEFYSIFCRCRCQCDVTFLNLPTVLPPSNPCQMEIQGRFSTQWTIVSLSRKHSYQESITIRIMKGYVWNVGRVALIIVSNFKSKLLC